jgi:hypothetical protein
MLNIVRTTSSLLLGALILSPAARAGEQSDIDRLVAALLGDTPLIEDLRRLTDEIGGRPTGSEANLRSVEWGLSRFREAGVDARKEGFIVPAHWLERSARSEVRGDSRFAVRVASMPYSAPTFPGGLAAPLVDGGTGGVEDFERLGEKARGAIVLVETPRLLDIPGLFAEYTIASAVESRAEKAGVAGLAYQSSRPPSVLYRQIVARGEDNALPMIVVERDAGMRMLRLLREGRSLEMFVELVIDTGGPFESYNVIGEIRGDENPEEIVVAGAHLDSWGLGQGALDNGCNVAMLVDVARQIRRLGLKPRRTIRFVLFNGEEHGFFGSLGYTRTHLDELDRHVLAQSYDIGSGRIVGYFTNGRPELSPAMERALEPVRGLGPFEILDIPVVGTDNFDFILQGVANLVANQESANYGENYHASSDTFDKVDQRQLRLNAAIAAAVTWSFAEMDVDWKRQRRSEVQQLIDTTDLGKEMRVFHLMEDWEQGERGRVATSP